MTNKIPTLGELRDEFFRLRKYAPHSYKDRQWKLRKNVGDWMSLPITELSADLILSRHKELSNKNGTRGSGEATANDVFKILRAMFNFAKVRYKDEHGQPFLIDNPVSILNELKQWNKIQARQTVIRRNKLPEWLRAVVAESSETMRDFFIFLWLTGCRKSEAAKLRWTDVDFSDGFVRLENTKTNVSFTLPLSRFLLSVLRRRYDGRGGNLFVFPGRSGEGWLSSNQNAINRINSDTGIKFINHDLRRGFISTAQSINVPLFIIKKLVNHSTTDDITSGYILFEDEDLRRHVERITHELLKLAEYDAEVASRYGIEFDAGYLVRQKPPTVYESLLCGGVNITVTRCARRRIRESLE